MTEDLLNFYKTEDRHGPAQLVLLARLKQSLLEVIREG